MSHLEGTKMPQEFLCPMSMQLMTDPVVTPTGVTYDRCVAAAAGRERLRAAVWRCTGHALLMAHLLWCSRVLPAFFLAASPVSPLICPSSSLGDVGNVARCLQAGSCCCAAQLCCCHLTPGGLLPCRRSALEQWIQRNHTDPATGQPLDCSQLYPNLSLRDMIQKWLVQPEVLVVEQCSE